MNGPYQCQHCQAAIAIADVNVSTDIALCRACGKTMSFAEIAPLSGAANIDFQKPPKGVRIDESPIRGKSVIYRKIPLVLIFLIPFTMAWSGFSMTGIYGSQIVKGEFQLALSLFGLPFLIGTVFLVSVILFGLFGRWRVLCNQGALEVAMEIGPIGWTRRLNYDRSARVAIKTSGWSKNGQVQQVIQVECQGQMLKFGSSISEPAKTFIAEYVRRSVAGEI